MEVLNEKNVTKLLHQLKQKENSYQYIYIYIYIYISYCYEFMARSQ